VLTAPRLRRGDRVKFVSPASPPDRYKVANGARILESWGLRVEIGAHVFDRWGHFLAGSDEDRLADINDALQDAGVRAIFSTTGGKGAYRIAHALDFAAAVRDPKPLIGYSDITILHLALWRECHLTRFNGPHVGWDPEYYGDDAADHLRRALDRQAKSSKPPRRFHCCLAQSRRTTSSAGYSLVSARMSASARKGTRPVREGAKPEGGRARSRGVGPHHTIDKPDEQKGAIFGGAWGEKGAGQGEHRSVVELRAAAKICRVANIMRLGLSRCAGKNDGDL
jgi:hypothetical protein